MNRYAIDQNVIYDAWRGKRVDNTPALPEKKFVYNFLMSDHIFVVNSTIAKKITKMNSEEMSDTQYVDNMVVPMFMKLIFDKNKTRYATETPIDGETVKKCDKHYVVVTINTNAILVTNDGRLKQAVDMNPRIGTCNIMRVEDALNTL